MRVSGRHQQIVSDPGRQRFVGEPARAVTASVAAACRRPVGSSLRPGDPSHRLPPTLPTLDDAPSRVIAAG